MMPSIAPFGERLGLLLGHIESKPGPRLNPLSWSTLTACRMFPADIGFLNI
jgi:hypothetical protein